MEGSQRRWIRRKGYTLLEVLVVIAIIFILIALLLSAVMKVRMSARFVESKNKLKQLALAFHNFDDFEGLRKYGTYGDGGGTVFTSLLPYLELADSNGNLVKQPDLFYLSQIDPSYRQYTYSNNSNEKQPGTTSYCVNSVFCNESLKLKNIFDGTSNTMLFCERYANCGKYSVYWSLIGSRCYIENPPNRTPVPCKNCDRRATFADNMYSDYMPKIDPASGVTVGSPENRLFQVAPIVSQCNMDLVQSLTPAGLCCAFADGSVRVLNPNISPSVFWSAVSPNGAETSSIE